VNDVDEDKRKADVNYYYDKVQWHYDHVWKTQITSSLHYGYRDKNHKGREAEIINMNRFIIEIAKIKVDDKVLDIGCGVGGTAMMIAKRYGVSVVGLNINEMQIERARKSIQDANLDDRIKIVNGDFTNIPFPDESFDVVIGVESTPHANDKKAVLTEVYRVLKKGGRFANSSYLLTKNEYKRHEKRHLDLFINGWFMTLIHGDKFKGILEEIGFNNINFTDTSRAVLISSLGMYTASWTNLPFILIGLASLLLFDPTTDMDTGTNNWLAGFFQYITLRKKLWKHGIFYAEKSNL